MIKRLKKGFTLTELVIVIAVIAILAAVLIPTFTSLIRKANISNDVSLAKNMNTILAQTQVGELQNMGEVLELLEQEGYGIDKYNPTSEGYRFVWDKSTNQILLLSEKFEVVHNAKDYNRDSWELWLTVQEPEDIVSATQSTINFNYFLAQDSSKTFAVTTLSSFDTGANVLSGNLSIANTGNANIAIAGNYAGIVTINTPAATVTHTGNAANVNITAVAANSYHEAGYTGALTIASGKVEVTANGYVENFINNSSTVSINNGIIKTYTQASGSAANLTNNGYVAQATDVPVTNPAAYTYDIANAAKLVDFASLVNNGANFAGITVRLTANIDLASISDWTPIGIGSNYFAGTFDGNNKTISNLVMTSTTYDKGFAYQATAGTSNSQYDRYAFGLFGGVVGGVVKNFTLGVDIDVTADDKIGSVGKYVYLGAVAGYLQADFDNGVQVANTGVIQNVTVNGDINAKGRLAGIVGWVDSGIILNATNNANVTSSYYGNNKAYSDAAGIVSWIRPANVNTELSNSADGRIVVVGNCTNNGDITGYGEDVAGIISALYNLHTVASIYGCDNTGDVTITAPADSGQKVYFSQIVGRHANNSNFGDSAIYDCTGSGVVTCALTQVQHFPAEGDADDHNRVADAINPVLGNIIPKVA